MTSGERRLPVLYGGHDAGPRPETRENVCAAMLRGVDPVVVTAYVAQGTSDLWAACLTALPASAPKPACARGCSYCCQQRVEVTAPEAFLIARALASADPVLLERISAAARRHAAVSAREHFLQQCPCPFLDDAGACAIYEVRPIACRRAHSVDVEVCRALARDPRAELRVPASEVIDWNTSALVLGYYEGLAHAGRPPHQYELAQAVVLALAEGSERRWAQGDDPLEQARTRDAATLTTLLTDDTARYPRATAIDGEQQ